MKFKKKMKKFFFFFIIKGLRREHYAFRAYQWKMILILSVRTIHLFLRMNLHRSSSVQERHRPSLKAPS